MISLLFSLEKEKQIPVDSTEYTKDLNNSLYNHLSVHPDFSHRNGVTYTPIVFYENSDPDFIFVPKHYPSLINYVKSLSSDISYYTYVLSMYTVYSTGSTPIINYLNPICSYAMGLYSKATKPTYYFSSSPSSSSTWVHTSYSNFIIGSVFLPKFQSYYNKTFTGLIQVTNSTYMASSFYDSSLPNGNYNHETLPLGHYDDSGDFSLFNHCCECSS